MSDIASAITGSIAADGQTPITGEMRGTTGTISTPSWTFTGDLTSGMYSAGAGILGLAANAFALLINSKGSIVATATPISGGSGYAVNDTIVITGGTALRNAVLTVASLSGSAVASVTISDAGLYSTQASNPVAQGSSSGGGTGATFTVTWTSAPLISDQNGNALWSWLGATTYMTTALTTVHDGLALANYIGAANIAAAVESALPIPTPQGYLTPTSGTTVITGDTTSSTLYYTPVSGLWNPIHNGTTIIPYQLSGELSLALTTAQAAGGIYDVFLAYNGNSPVIGTGPSWAAGTSGSVTAGSCARGTGAGGTSLTRLHGLLVNTVAISLIYNTGSGNNTITVPINQGIYLGSIYISGSAGSITCQRSFGQNRVYDISNAYIRFPTYLKAGDSTATWTYSTDLTWRAANANTANSLTVFQGLAEEPYNFIFENSAFINFANASASFSGGIGFNSTSSPSGKIGTYFINGTNINTQNPNTVLAKYNCAPTLGINIITALEAKVPPGSPGSVTSTLTTTFCGTEAYMCLTAAWRV